MVTHVLKSFCGPQLCGHLCSCFTAGTPEGTGLCGFLDELRVAFITSLPLPLVR